MAVNGVNPPAHDEWCHSPMKSVHFSFMLTIDNFSLRDINTKKFWESSTFTPGYDSQVKFRLAVYRKDDYGDYVSVLLNFIETTIEFSAKFDISILNDKKEKTNTIKMTKTLSDTSRFMFRRLIKSDLLMASNELLPEDTLTLFCEGTYFQETDNISGNNNAVQVPECTALYELGLLLESGILSDVTISVCDENILAHKAILAARSTVFFAMFNSKMEEEKQSRVVITDITFKVMRAMLQFIYTGKVPNIEEMAAGLLAAADKYDLGRLRAMCADSLSKTIAIDNAIDILILADRHSEERLKSQIICFINIHMNKIIHTRSYKSMVVLHPYLINEIFRTLAIT